METQSEPTRYMLQLKGGKHKGLTISLLLMKRDEAIKILLKKDRRRLLVPIEELAKALELSVFGELSCYPYKTNDQLNEILHNDPEASDWLNSVFESFPNPFLVTMHQDEWKERVDR